MPPLSWGAASRVGLPWRQGWERIGKKPQSFQFSLSPASCPLDEPGLLLDPLLMSGSRICTALEPWEENTTQRTHPWTICTSSLASSPVFWALSPDVSSSWADMRLLRVATPTCPTHRLALARSSKPGLKRFENHQVLLFIFHQLSLSVLFWGASQSCWKVGLRKKKKKVGLRRCLHKLPTVGVSAFRELADHLTKPAFAQMGKLLQRGQETARLPSQSVAKWG